MLIDEALKDKREIVISPVAVAETVRGGARDTRINQLLQSARVPPIGLRLARQAGQLLAESGTAAVADAVVMAEALARGPAVLLTSDPEDMRRLAGRRTTVRVVAV